LALIKIEAAAMERVGSGFCDVVLYCAGVAAILGAVVVCDDLELLDGNSVAYSAFCCVAVNGSERQARLLKCLAQAQRIKACEKFLCLGGESALRGGLLLVRMQPVGFETVNANHDGNRMRCAAGEFADLRLENEKA
jgi:hypothetical protein